MKTKVLMILMGGVLLAFNSGALAVTMDWVTVGNAGNAADTQVMSDGTTGYGGVSDVYQISKYEVTTGQYTEFLSAVAATDTYGLYNTQMWSDSQGCKIQRDGSPDSYTYSVAGDWASRPVNYVSWGDSVRFTNWLYNGQPTEAQGLSTTEDGSYYLNGAMTTAELMAITRETDATWVIPSEDEWYKAAYYTGSGYSTFANGTDTAPSTSDTCYDQSTPYTGPWDINTGTIEQNGTFDMMGNVWEWNETPINLNRGVRGGAFYTDDNTLASSYRNFISDPDYENNAIGFRVVSIPEPATIALLGLGGLLLRKRRDRKQSKK